MATKGRGRRHAARVLRLLPEEPGKVLRGAWTADNGQVTLFSAMIHGVGVIVAQIRVPDGTNEIHSRCAILRLSIQ